MKQIYTVEIGNSDVEDLLAELRLVTPCGPRIRTLIEAMETATEGEELPPLGRKWRPAIWALIDALPKCDLCQLPATRAPHGRGGTQYCDEHGVESKAPELSQAAPLRTLIELLGHR